MIPLDTNTLDKTLIATNIRNQYEAYEVPKWFGWVGLGTKTRLRHTQTKAPLCSPEKLNKILADLLPELTAKDPVEKKIGGKHYFCHLDKEHPTIAHIYKVIDDIGEGSFNRVFTCFSVTSGNFCAYKIPIDKPSPPPATLDPKKAVLTKDKEVAPPPPAEKESKEIQPAHILQGEFENLTFLKNKIESGYFIRSEERLKSSSTKKDKRLESLSIEEKEEKELQKHLKLIWKKQRNTSPIFELLPITPKGAFYEPFAFPVDKLEFKTRTDFVFELGEKSLNDYLSYGFASNLTRENIWQYANQLLAILRLFEALEIVHTDIKPHNMVLLEGKLLLIDFDVLVTLPPNNNEAYSYSYVPYTRLYRTEASCNKLHEAKTNTEARESWLYSQRVTFAHTFFGLFSLTPLIKDDEVKQNVEKKNKDQVFTRLDIRKMPNFEKFPAGIQQLLLTLLDEDLPSIDASIDFLSEMTKTTYFKETFKIMQDKRPEHINPKYAYIITRK